MQGGANADRGASHELVEIKSFLYLHVLQERGVLGALFLPQPFPCYLWERFSRGRAEPCRRGGGGRSQLLLSPHGQSQASGPALRTRKKGGWVRGREGGRGEEGEARQSGFKFRHKSKQILSFPECGARETTSSKLCLRAQTWGHRMCISSTSFSLPLPIFYHLIFIPLPPLRLVSISLYCLQFLPWYLCFDLSAVHTSLSQAAGSLACLFVRRESLPF